MNDIKNEERLLRLRDIVPGIIPISKSQWWSGVKNGIYPPGIKLGPCITAWRWSDIVKLMENGIEQKKGSPAVGAAGDRDAHN